MIFYLDIHNSSSFTLFKREKGKHVDNLPIAVDNPVGIVYKTWSALWKTRGQPDPGVWIIYLWINAGCENAVPANQIDQAWLAELARNRNQTGGQLPDQIHTWKALLNQQHDITRTSLLLTCLQAF